MTFLVVASATIERGVTTNRVRVDERVRVKKQRTPRLNRRRPKRLGATKMITFSTSADRMKNAVEASAAAQMSLSEWIRQASKHLQAHLEDEEYSGKTVVRSMIVPLEDLAEMDRAAKRAGMSRSAWLVRASEYFERKVFGDGDV